VCLPHFLNTFKVFTINIGHTTIKAGEKATNRGVIFDDHLDIPKPFVCMHISLCFVNLKIDSVYKYLNDDSVAQMVHAFIMLS
jgi:hypothetical protein